MGQQRHLDRVKALVSGHTGVPEAEITPESRLVEDLGIDGDDGHELLEAFADEFGVDLSAVATFNYFGDEPPGPGFSSLIPVAAWLSPRFREYARHAARGWRTVTVRNLVASARAGRWIRPETPAEGADPTRFTWPARLVLAGSVALPAGIGRWQQAHGTASPENATALALGVGALLWMLLIARFLWSLRRLRRLDAAATYEEQHLTATN